MTDLLVRLLRLLGGAIHNLVCGIHLLGGRGFHLGHFHRHGAGFAFAGRMLAAALAAVVGLTVAGMAHLAVSDWVEKRYASPELTRAAGILTFIIVLALIGLGAARFL